MDFQIIVVLISIFAGAIASVSGFGIGSMLTPLFGTHVSIKLAVAAVSIPHFIGTVVRCWTICHDIDRKVLISFGITSALGSLAGALIHNVIRSSALNLIFGVILIFAGLLGVTGWSERLRFNGWMALAAGALSGCFGGLVGNQGGIRAAALLGFDLNKNAFIATTTAIALFVDAARMPVYFFTEFKDIVRIWPLVTVATIGVLLGTFAGIRFLKNVQEKIFKRIVSMIILALGVYMLLQSY